MALGLNRMAMSHLVIVLANWAEFYQDYKAVLPDDVRTACKVIYQEINRREIPVFRNAVVAHLGDKHSGRPLPSAEINQLFSRLIEGDPDRFRLWINNPQNNTFPNSVVAVTQHTRDRLRTEFSLSDEEVVR